MPSTIDTPVMPSGTLVPPTQRRMLFIGGLHRSGTSLVCRTLGQHPELGTLQKTNVAEDEGQHLQDVYPPGKVHGGPGRFGFAAAAHLTEKSSLIGSGSAERLWQQWLPYWDTSRPWLAEKSPPNLIRSRFLQAIFPKAHFLMIVRHPIATSLATQKWSWTTLESLLAHWSNCHRLMRADLPHLKRVRVIRYEDFIDRPQQTASELFRWLDLPEHTVSANTDRGINQAYFERWTQFRQTWLGTWRARNMIYRHRAAWDHFGYDECSYRPLHEERETG